MRISFLSGLFILTFSILCTTSCKKKSSAGLGGNANLKITVKHHGLEIDSAIVYIKFNVSEAPAGNNWNINKKVEVDTNGNAYAMVNGLKKGDYYIYAEGWDPSISENVKGGIPYTIVTETDIAVLLPVTESH